MRAKNSMQFLLDENGVEQFADRDKGEVAARYFSNLFKTSDPSSFVEDFVPKATEKMNLDFIRAVTLEELRIVVFSIDSEKAPRHDGMTGFFYKKF